MEACTYTAHIAQDASSCLHDNATLWIQIDCLPFMWCWALVHKGSLRFGAFFLSGWSVSCSGLVLGWPSWELNSFPPHLASTSFKASELRQMPGALGHTKTLLTWRPKEQPWAGFYHSALGGWLFISACCEKSSSFLPRLWKVCLFRYALPVSPMLPPLTQALRSFCSKIGSVESSKISTRILIYSYQTAFSFLTSCFHEVSSLYGPFLRALGWVIPTDPICSLVP